MSTFLFYIYIARFNNLICRARYTITVQIIIKLGGAFIILFV